jgi:hypothetical protein
MLRLSKRRQFRQELYNDCGRKERTMEESKRNEIEEKWRKMLMTTDESQHKDEQSWKKLCGARVIRRRKGSPDVAIA